MMDWLEALVRYQREGSACVVVTIVDVRGSAPRGVGTRMTVAASAFDGTVGGGALEMAALEHARSRLAVANQESSGALSDEVTIPLARALSQCCGGEVTLRFEHHPALDFRVEVFGAGHVAQELARLLVRLPCRARFHDSRAEWLQRVEDLDASGRVQTRLLDPNVSAAVEAGAPNAYWLVMTHSHELDLEVVEAVLSRGDGRYCGLIASRSKAASFRGRLSRKGFTDAELAQLTAPLGRAVSTGNTPMEVAIAAMSDILNARHAIDTVVSSTTTH